MATRGRKPKPPRIAARPAGPPDGWDCPIHLVGDAGDAWAHLVGLLAAAGNLDRTDPTIVEAYAVNAALLREAYRELKENGAVVTNGMGAPAPNPAIAMINAATMRLKAIAYDLGLVPATSKYGADRGQDNPAADKWGDLLGVVG